MAKHEGDDKLLRDMREKFTAWTQFWAENYKEGDRDMDCLSAEKGPWPQEEIDRRKKAERPVVHVDIDSQFNRRIVNQARLNPRGIVITPVGTEANDDTANMREDRIRQIDYDSMAVQARINAIQNAVDRGIGFYMVTTDFIRHDSFDQKIGTRQIPNSKSVILDPYAKEADLVISGHTHGGQIRLPGIGPVPPLPTKLGRAYDRGVFGFGEEGTLFITQGVGETGPRARLFARPTIDVLTIRY